jgi:hypothetical protein
MFVVRGSLTCGYQPRRSLQVEISFFADLLPSMSMNASDAHRRRKPPD